MVMAILRAVGLPPFGAHIQIAEVVPKHRATSEAVAGDDPEGRVPSGTPSFRPWNASEPTQRKTRAVLPWRRGERNLVLILP